MNIKLSDKHVRSLLNKWRARLRLMDWDVTWEWVEDLENVEEVELIAHVDFDVDTKRANILLNASLNWHHLPSKVTLTAEEAIGHELVHVYLAELGFQSIYTNNDKFAPPGMREIIQNSINGVEEAICDNLPILFKERV